MATPSGPNPLRVAWSVWRAQRRRAPAPSGTATVDHSELAPVLAELRSGGVPALQALRTTIGEYRDSLTALDPDSMPTKEALAYWLNLYNAGALDLAADTAAVDAPSVLRVPGGFQRPWATVSGEDLSLDAIEHGKIRRFRDPRIHAALVCGSASCPTLRYEPYSGDRLDAQLDDQLRSFLRSGGAVADCGTSTLRLSRVFLWYGGDFTRPHRMPTWLPARRRTLVGALRPWLEPATVAWIDGGNREIVFQPYDWSLACAIG